MPNRASSEHTARRHTSRRWAIVGAGVLAAASLGISSGDASAATASDTSTETVDVVGPGSGAVAAFDPSLGTLTRVDWSVSTDALAQVCIENLSQQSGTTTGGTAGSTLGVTFPSGTTTTSTSAVPVPNTSLPASNGADDCDAGFDSTTATFLAPVSASDVVYGSATAPQMSSGNITDSAALTTFIGPGTVPYSFQFNSNATIANPSEWDITFIAEGTLTVTVTYNYVPTAAPTTTTTAVTTTTATPGTTTTTPGTTTTTTIASEAPVSTIQAPTTTTIVPTVPTTPTGSLPRTGSSPNGTLIAALFALAGGCSLFVVSRRKLRTPQ